MNIKISLPIFSDLVTIQKHAKKKGFTFNTGWSLEDESRVLSISDFTGFVTEFVNVYTNADNIDPLFFKNVSPDEQLKIEQALRRVYLYILDINVALADKSTNVSFKRMMAGFLALPLIYFYEQKSKNVTNDLNQLVTPLNNKVATLAQEISELTNSLNQNISDLSADKSELKRQIDDVYKTQIQHLHRVTIGGGCVIVCLSAIIIYLTLYKKQ